MLLLCMIFFQSTSPLLIRSIDNFKEHLDCKKFQGAPILEWKTQSELLPFLLSPSVLQGPMLAPVLFNFYVNY